MGNAAEARTEAEAAATNLNDTHAAPPAYAQYDNGYPSHPSTSAVAPGPEPQAFLNPINMSPSLSPYHQFPTDLYAYLQWNKNLLRAYHLGDHSCRKLYTLSTYSGVSSSGPGVPCMIIHNGPSEKDPALATVREEKGWNMLSRNSIITMPPDPEDPGRGETTEVMVGEAPNGRSDLVFRFSVEVNAPKGAGGAGGRIREDFEWRKMHQDELNNFKNGYKLFRLRPGQPSSPLVGGVSADHVGEVVASARFKSATSVIKPFCMSFHESGDGEGLTTVTDSSGPQRQADADAGPQAGDDATDDADDDVPDSPLSGLLRGVHTFHCRLFGREVVVGARHRVGDG
ncbi:hypothetical protein CMUS01_05903 [Colletotrichum musicola]|uniref:Uncharacterized protein n=1 Tax=Colletotrichum musicola TaxID=2175873 RepID=A0A8H6KP57_9PEZI|nr:hypothetical protein CMUS01_05903 [Colletotrichum musicola]